jgi:hypothetical protein
VAFPGAPVFAMPAAGPAAPLSEITLTAVADATLDRASPDANFGADVRLKTLVDEHLTVTQRALLRFDLPADVLIDAARLELKLNQTGGPASVTLRAYQVTAAWSEMAVTWNNQPAPGSRYADAAVGTGTGWFAWDVTAIARAWQTEPNYGLLLDIAPPSQTAYAYRAFLSRQGKAPPRLVVTYHRPNYTLYAPATGRPGAELPVAGENFIPGAAVTLQVAQGASVWSCGSATPDANGTFRGRCTVPMTASPGATVLRARSGSGGLLAETAVQIVAGPGLQLSPSSGPPGTVVNYTVTNLVAGSLRLDYAGMPVAGPLPTVGGSAAGTFVVPGDRPAPLGSATTVKATNLVGGLPARPRISRSQPSARQKAASFPARHSQSPGRSAQSRSTCGSTR